MPDYNFTGAYPRVLTGLSQGVNALILPTDRDTPPYGSTIEAFPGDSVQTNEPYAHAELAEVEEGTYAPPAEPSDDPAHDAMTAEGAPAPAEPTA
jgi:hypothetical protein